MIEGWRGEALNLAEDSANEIHSDKVAKQFGFRGGLVPGVTISAYLIHPAVTTWGLDFLHRGYAHVRVSAPLYDGEPFAVDILEQSDSSYRAEITQADKISATAEVSLPELAPAAPTRRGDPVGDRSHKPTKATRAAFEQLKSDGCLAFRYRWREKNNEPYVQDIDAIPGLLRANGDGYANMNFLLGITNWVLSANAHMNPWMHLETKSQNYRAVAEGTSLIAEIIIADLTEKKGHEFVDAQINLFDEEDDTCVCAIELRAIYRLRGA